MRDSFSPMTPPRERNTVLAALELFRSLDLPRTQTSMLLFLYVCENEGLNVTELAEVSRMQVAGAARVTRALAGGLEDEPAPPQSVLFELRTDSKDRRLRFVHLSDRGREVRDQLEALIERGAPIVASPAVSVRMAI
jgi:DNA-binding MarR family transcriptional regulator